MTPLPWPREIDGARAVREADAPADTLKRASRETEGLRLEPSTNLASRQGGTSARTDVAPFGASG